MPVVHDTFVLERTYAVAQDQVFNAFADAGEKRAWFTDAKSQSVEAFVVDFRVGGVERATYRFKEGTPFPGVELSNEGIFQDIVPGRRIVLATTMTLGGRRISSALITVEVEPDGEDSRLTFTHQAAFYEGSDGPQMRQDGWRLLLDGLGRHLAR